MTLIGGQTGAACPQLCLVPVTTSGWATASVLLCKNAFECEWSTASRWNSCTLWEQNWCENVLQNQLLCDFATPCTLQTWHTRALALLSTTTFALSHQCNSSIWGRCCFKKF